MVQYYPHENIDENDLIRTLRIREGARVVMGVGPCRVGTKAQLHTLAASGYPAYEQPLKSAYRCLGHGREPESVEFAPGVTYIKETLGPYTEGEARFNPLGILRRAAGEPWVRENLTLVFLTRNPTDTWISWYQQWSEDVEPRRLFDFFRRSFRTTVRILEEARSLEVPHHGFDYELNRDPAGSYRSLFRTLGLHRPPVVSDWNQRPVADRIDRNLVLFREPDVFLPDGIRDTVRSSDGLHYQTYEDPSVPVPGDQEPVLSDYETVKVGTGLRPT